MVIFFYGHYEPELTNLIRCIVKPGFVVLDVGANIGCHTLIMGKLAEDHGRVLAFEPHPQVFAVLSENVMLNRLTNIKLLQCALGDVQSKLALYSGPSHLANFGGSSLHAGNVANQGYAISVTVRTVDEIVRLDDLSRLDLIKIDTEGHELPVLLGARESIRQYRPHIIFEYDSRTWGNAGLSVSSAKDFFAELNYILYIVEREGHLTRVESSWPASINILAVPQQKNSS